MAHQPIVMPKLGLTMTEGMLVEWKVAPGDPVAKGDVLFIVETDKISNEIEASEAGVIEALHAVTGDTVAVGTLVATLVTEGAGGDNVPAARQAEPPAATLAEAPPVARDAFPAIGGDEPRPIATPLARRLAFQAGLDIGHIKGSGPRGRITADDVGAARDALVKPETVEARLAPELPAPPHAASRLLPISRHQQATARLLTQSKREIPHFYVFAEADVTALLAAREQLNGDPAFPKITVNHFIVAALARALARMPELNRVWSDEGLVEYLTIDIGLAVEGPKGLVAPVLRDLGGASLDGVARAAGALVERARSGRLAPDDLRGGATAVSNVGMFGATGLIPIINPGQSSILGVGRNQGVFRPDARGRPRLRQVLALTLSCDHRVVDGALAARFLQSVQHGLEAPLALLRQVSQGQSQ